MSSLCLDHENPGQVFPFPLHPCLPAPWWGRHLTNGRGSWRALVDNSIFLFFFSRSADCSSLDMLNKGDLLLKLFSCDQHHILRKTPPSWSHALALKKSKGKRLMTSTIPVLRSCHIHRIAHCDGWTRPLIFCLGDHCLSKWLLTLLLQYFQKLARRCLLVPGSP